MLQIGAFCRAKPLERHPAARRFMQLSQVSFSTVGFCSAKIMLSNKLLTSIVAGIDTRRAHGNLSSSIWLFVRRSLELLRMGSEPGSKMPQISRERSRSRQENGKTLAHRKR